MCPCRVFLLALGPLGLECLSSGFLFWTFRVCFCSKLRKEPLGRCENRMGALGVVEIGLASGVVSG